MAIVATNSGTKREPIPAGNYIARCYQMLHIGTVNEVILGTPKTLNKVRIGWELPTELKEYKEGEGEKPAVISKEYTLSMNDRANLRKMLASWRGKDFSEEEAKAFDITKLLGVPCMLNVIHKTSADGQRTYEEIAGVTPMPRGMTCPPQICTNLVWDYDQPDLQLLESLPDFIKEKIKSSEEYKSLVQPNASHLNNDQSPESIDDLPF